MGAGESCGSCCCCVSYDVYIFRLSRTDLNDCSFFPAGGLFFAWPFVAQYLIDGSRIMS